MACISLPKKIYFKQGCLPVALEELRGRKRAFLIGSSKAVEDKLNELEIQHTTCIGTAEDCLKQIRLFEPDVIIAVGSRTEMEICRQIKGIDIVAVLTEDWNGAEQFADMVIIDRSDNLPPLTSAFQEMM